MARRFIGNGFGAQLAAWLSVCWVLGAPAAATLAAQEYLPRSATWQLPTAGQVRGVISQWIDGAGEEVAPAVRQQLQKLLDDSPRLTAAPLDNAATALFLLIPDAALLAEQINGLPDRAAAPWQRPGLLDDDRLPESARQTLALLAGRWLARHQQYEQAMQLLEELSVDDVIDPAALLYYRGLAQHRLIRMEPCIESLEKLLEHADQLPRRYTSISRLMLADARSVQADSLDEVARLMEDIGRRQSLQQSGSRVIGQQEEVIAKLDKLIEETRQKMQQQQQQQAARQAGPSNPMPDSQSSGGQGTGRVTERQVTGGGTWGNLPPQQRAAALVEMTRDLPPHYREVIEEYFRQLAREKNQ